jgi:hypothetical protein
MVRYFKYRIVLIIIYLTSSCVNLAFLGTRWSLKRSFPNELNTTFFCSTSPLKAPNRLKSLKLARRFVLTSCENYQNSFTQEKIPKFWQCRIKKWNYESMMNLLPIILFVTIDIYEKVKIRRFKCIRTMKTDMTLIYDECDKTGFWRCTFMQTINKNSACFQSHLTKRMMFMSKTTKLHC